MPTKKLDTLIPAPVDLCRMPAGTTAIYKLNGTDANYFMGRIANYASQVGAKVKQKNAFLLEKVGKKLEASHCVTVTVAKQGKARIYNKPRKNNV